MDIIIKGEDSRIPEGRHLTETQKRAVWNSLSVAAHCFEENEREFRKAAKDSATEGQRIAFTRLADQFKHQAVEARGLIETFE